MFVYCIFIIYYIIKEYTENVRSCQVFLVNFAKIIDLLYIPKINEHTTTEAITAAR